MRWSWQATIDASGSHRACGNKAIRLERRGLSDWAPFFTAKSDNGNSSALYCIASAIMDTACVAARRLRWCEVKPDRLALIDAKTGPRHVLLGEAVPDLLNGLADSASGEWVFPGDKGNGPLNENEL